jgi:hypothetical protein
MPKNYTQCPFCSATVEEGAGFDVRVWMRSHLKSCVGVKPEPMPKPEATGKASKRAKSASPTQEVVGRVGEALAKEFVKQLFKKGR